MNSLYVASLGALLVGLGVGLWMGYVQARRVWRRRYERILARYGRVLTGAAKR